MTWRTPLHPVTVESDMMSAISDMTGLSWNELNDPEIIWFMLKGMRPSPDVTHFDARHMWWTCYAPGRDWRTRQVHPSCGRTVGPGCASSSRMREAVRQHLRDKHGLVRPVHRIVTTVPLPEWEPPTDPASDPVHRTSY